MRTSHNAVFSALILALIVPFSQSFAADDRVIEEIVVTARKQDETLQDVPVTITSVGREQLENFQLDQPQEIAERIPNFNIQSGGSGSGGTLNLRGVGSSAISAAFDSAVAFDIDGVSISRMRMVQSAFLDLAQVDVLKGPQSLYFGKSASAGVLSFRSADPGEEFEAKFGGGYDFELEGYYADGVVSGPLSDTLGARLAVRYSENDKLWENTAPGGGDEGEEDLNARVTLLWTPSDTVTVNFKTTITNHEADSAIGNFDVLCSVPGDPQPSNFSGGPYPAGYDCDYDDGKSQISGHNVLFRPNVAGQRNLSPFEELDTLLSRVQLDWDINDSMTLTSVTSYFELEEEGAACYGYTATVIGGIGCNYTVNETDAFAQELRLSGDLSDNVSFLIGAFYQERDLLFDTAQEAVGGANLAGLLALPTVDPVTGFTDDWRKIHDTESETKSVFASVTWQATERLELTAGARYSEEERTQEISVPSIFYLFGPPTFVPAGFQSGKIKFDDDNVSPEVSALYALNDDVNLFVAYKSGYKSGGVDNSALPSSSLALAAATGDFGALIYETEEGEGFEIGMKGRFAEGAMRLDVTAFRYVYDDLQVQSFNSSAIQFSTTNAGELVSQGLEADLTWLPNVDGLSIYGSLSILDAEFSDSFIPEPPAGITDPAVIAQYDLDGRSTSGAADYAFNVGFDYVMPIADSGLEWGIGFNTSFSDEYETQNEDPDGFVQDSFWLLNARAFLGAADGGWQVSVMGRNLADELYVVTSGGRPFADVSNNTLLPGGIGLSDTILNYARGRQLFLEFKVQL